MTQPLSTCEELFLFLGRNAGAPIQVMGDNIARKPHDLKRIDCSVRQVRDSMFGTCAVKFSGETDDRRFLLELIPEHNEVRRDKSFSVKSQNGDKIDLFVNRKNA